MSRFVVLILAFAVLGQGLAQSDRSVSNGEIASDLEASAPKATDKPTLREINRGISSAVEMEVREKLDEADRFREKRKAIRDDSIQARDYKRLEVLKLLEAAYLGDDSQKVRREKLISNIKNDRSYSSEQRCEVAAYAKNLQVERSGDLPLEVKIEEYERVARELLIEFPEVEVCYESLLGIAMSKTGMAGLPVAQELLENPNTPDSIRVIALRFVERCDLVGKSLADLADTVTTESTPLETTRGRKSLIYTWSSEEPGSLEIIEKAISEVAGEVLIVGFNLAGEPEEAKRREKELQPPGVQLYREPGVGDALMQAFIFDYAPHIYISNSRGEIETVTGFQDLLAKVEGGEAE